MRKNVDDHDGDGDGDDDDGFLGQWSLTHIQASSMSKAGIMLAQVTIMWDRFPPTPSCFKIFHGLKPFRFGGFLK